MIAPRRFDRLRGRATAQGGLTSLINQEKTITDGKVPREIELPKNVQLELIGMEPHGRFEKKTCAGDAEFAEVRSFQMFYEPHQIDALHGVYLADRADNRRLENMQIQLYALRDE